MRVLGSLPQPVENMSTDEIMQLSLEPIMMAFANSNLIQHHLSLREESEGLSYTCTDEFLVTLPPRKECACAVIIQQTRYDFRFASRLVTHHGLRSQNFGNSNIRNNKMMDIRSSGL